MSIKGDKVCIKKELRVDYWVKLTHGLKSRRLMFESCMKENNNGDN